MINWSFGVEEIESRRVIPILRSSIPPWPSHGADAFSELRKPEDWSGQTTICAFGLCIYTWPVHYIVVQHIGIIDIIDIHHTRTHVYIQIYIYIYWYVHACI